MAIICPDDPIRVLMSIPVASVEPTMSRADLATLEPEGHAPGTRRREAAGW
jgi:hypothetical protein